MVMWWPVTGAVMAPLFRCPGPLVGMCRLIIGVNAAAQWWGCGGPLVEGWWPSGGEMVTEWWRDGGRVVEGW
jgi:hypothetical protein